MLSNSDILDLAEGMTDYYRNVVMIDPVIRIVYKTEQLGTHIKIEKSSSPLTWNVTICPNLHKTHADIKESVINVLSEILLNEMEFLQSPNLLEVKQRIACRITLTLSGLLPDLEEDEETE